MSARRLEHQRERAVQLLRGQQQSALGRSAISVRRDHVRRTHHRRLGPEAVHSLSGGTHAVRFGNSIVSISQPAVLDRGAARSSVCRGF